MTFFHFRRFILVEPQLFDVTIFHPSYCMILLVKQHFTFFKFIDSSKRNIRSEKYKNHFHTERTYNSVSESENTVRGG